MSEHSLFARVLEVGRTFCHIVENRFEFVNYNLKFMCTERFYHTDSLDST